MDRCRIIENGNRTTTRIQQVQLWIDPENVILLIPIDAAILAVLWVLERRLRRVQQ